MDGREALDSLLGYYGGVCPILLESDYGQESDVRHRCPLPACDLLATYDMGPDNNYGLGNSLNQAPSGFLVDDCNAGQALACAELAARGE